jgi:hypothetical protein
MCTTMASISHAHQADLRDQEDKVSTMLNCVEPDEELIIGADAISRELFGGQLNARAVYRLLETDPTWPALKIAGKWAVRRGAMKEEIRRRERRPGRSE